MNLYYLHFNNYYNRIVKKFDTLAEYLTLPYYDNVVTQSIAFNPNDGVTTKQVANIPIDTTFNYDYAILADGNEIVSRWYILDAKRNLNGQYNLSLKRDLFADSYEPVLDAPAFIEKATLNFNDPMIFNSESMTFNQIKKSETLLTDETGCPWIVGYLARNDSSGNRQDYSISFTPKTAIDIEVADITDWEFYEYNQSNPYVTNWNIYYSILYKKQTGTGRYLQSFNSKGVISTTSSNSSTSSSLIYPTDEYTGDYGELAAALDRYIGNFKPTQTTEDFTKFLNLNGKVIYDETTQKSYRINLIRTSSNGTITINQANYPDLFNIFKAAFPNGNDSSFGYGWENAVGYFISLSEISENTTYNLNIGDRFNLENAPYDMFCMPYSDGIQVFKNGVLTSASSVEIAFNAAMELSRKYGNDSARSLYDLQLLPYCPARFIIQEDGMIDVGNNDLGVSYITQSGGGNVCPIFFCDTDNFTLNINLETPIEITNPKLQSECDMYRICSPNYNGVFEFNAAKNGGITFFNVDCTYKPYNPYIHINPNFGKLYGEDFNDSRGLIVGGDFSLPQTTSAWESYQLSNKNFQASFDRQIQNMEINNNIQKIQAVTQMAAGTAQATATGWSSGGILGAIAGGTASAVAGAMDVALLAASQAETLDYTKDQFGYSLGNIKALPQGLSKTSALVYNNKFFPFLEYYTCTEEEKIALENKIRYNGMTVMRIGTIREFLKSEKTYIKGKIIRFEEFNEDFHYVNELANEFNKGVFI